MDAVIAAGDVPTHLGPRREPDALEPPDAQSAGAVICGSSVGSIHPGMSAQIAVGLTLAAACAPATNVGSILKHRGANAVPAFAVRRPLRSTRALLGSGWFACGLGLALFAGVLHIAALAVGQCARRVIAHRGVLLGAAAGAFFGLGDIAVKAITPGTSQPAPRRPHPIRIKLS